MYLRLSTILALCATPFAFAANPNPFNIPQDGLAASAGTPLTLSWKPTTSGTVTLVLRSGSSNNLNTGTVIASSIANSGSYTWTPTNAFTRGSDYAIEIVDDSNPSLTNYTPYFVLDTSNTVASATPTVTMGATTTSLTSQTNAPTLSSSSSSGSVSTETTKTVATVTTGKSMTTSASSSGSSSMMSGTTNMASASSSAIMPPSSTGGVGARATAAIGMLGLVAAGALAL